jgi:hypothetical protein
VQIAKNKLSKQQYLLYNYSMEKSKKIQGGRLLTGIVFIAIGLFLLLVRFTDLPIGRGLWPFFLIVGGLLFYVGYFLGINRTSGGVGLLFPGTYLLIIGLLFLVLNIIGWHYMQFLWPIFVLGVAISLAVMYLFTPADGKEKKDLRSSALILFIISLGLFIIAARAGIFWPIALVIMGILVILKSFKK